ncbi:internalin-A precursor [mine drainage metagenome]|uniref:Internalin-A n=1 Tax=mine drainage metagenome TaxID=410659 RepID=A0A1J5PV90_9ZZZZ
MAPQVAGASTALTLNAFTRSGYTFDHWAVNANGSGTTYADGALYDFSTDLTLYAQWTAALSHTVTFNANGGVGTMAPQVANIPTALNLNTFTRVGYAFVGWNTIALGGGTAYANGGIYPFDADVTLYAQWITGAYTVTFDANGGTGTMAPQVASTPTALTLNTYTRAGYTFTGWNMAANGSSTAYADGALYAFTANLTLYAQWLIIPTYTVTFNANGGTGTMAPQVASGSNALTLNAFTLAGYTFTGWNTVAEGGGTAYADGALYNFVANLTLYAQWAVVVNHTVTFLANDGVGTMAPQVASVPTALTLNAFTRSGYSFTGWNTLANGTGTAFADGAVYSFAADISLYAQWTVVVVTSHTVTFMANGGTGTMAPQVSSVPAALTINAFALTGYNFVGWNTVPTGVGTTYANGAIYSFAADMVLYAQWNLVVVPPVYVPPVYVPPVTVTPAPPAAPPAPIAQTPALVLTAVPTQVPLGAFAALSTVGGIGNGVVTYATSTPAVCTVDGYGLVKGVIAGTCTVTATRAADGTYLSLTSAPVDITFIDLMAGTTPEPPAASPGLPATGLTASVARTVRVSGSALSKSIKINLGAALGGKKATVQIRKVGTKVYRSLSVVMLNKAGFAQLTRPIPFGSAIRVLVGGRSLAATIVR